MKFKGLVKETATTIGTGPFVRQGAVANFRAFTPAYAVGDSAPYCARQGAQFEIGEGTVTATTVERTRVIESSNGDQLVNFTSGAIELFVTVPPDFLNGAKVTDLPLVSALLGGDLTGDNIIIPIIMGDVEVRATLTAIAAAVLLLNGGSAPADTTKPNVSAASVANATPNQIVFTFSETLAAFTPAASAFTVSGGKAVSSVSRSGNTITLTVSASYASGDVITASYTPPASNALQDAAGNLVDAFTNRAVANNIAAAGATVPGAPTNVVATAGSGSASVAFNPPASNGGAGITSYTVTASTGQTGTGTASPITVAGLANGTPVTFTVKATNAIGTGPSSVASASVTPVAAATVPGAPTIGAAVAGDGFVDVAFSAPASNGGSAILEYTATLSTGQTAVGTVSPIRVTAPNGTAVTATVTARNSVGVSAASAASNSVTPAAIVAYTITGYGGNSLKTALTAADASYSGGSYGNRLGFTNSKFSTLASNQQYWKIVKTADGTTKPASARSGWSESNTVPPAEIAQTANADGITSINGATPMTMAAAACGNNSILWTEVGTTKSFYLWFKPEDGAWFCINANAPLVVTA